MTGPRMGEIVHFVPAQYDAEQASHAAMPYVERPAIVVESIGLLACLHSINRTGTYFGQDIPHDPAGAEWTWHHADACPRGIA